ncbi:MAG TPA: glycosyltransferase, partial [Blastocatellia bacterium]|nr:glycosyltransferase [Blastocatellia bacterium]
GYVRKEPGQHSREEMRCQLQIGDGQRLALVTSGGGQDGFALIETYLAAARAGLPEGLKSLIVCGPEMPAAQRMQLQQQAAADAEILFREFAGDMMSLMAAADVVVSMGGYNTVCEILSLRKSAIVVPRAEPTEEQWIRADRLSRLGFFRSVAPNELTPERLQRELAQTLGRGEHSFPNINLNALPTVAARVNSLLFDRQS